MAGVESRKLAFRRSTNATASRHVVPTFPTGVFYVFFFLNLLCFCLYQYYVFSNSITEAIRDERKLGSGGLEFVGAADDGDELGEFVGFGVMLLDVLLGGIAIAGIAGGDVEGNPEVGAGVGGGEGFASRINGGEGLKGLGLQLRLAFLIADEMGADEHQGEEMEAGGLVLHLVVAVVIEAGEHGGIAAARRLIARALHATVEDGQQVVLGVLDEIGADEVGLLPIQDDDLAGGDVPHLDVHHAGHEFEGQTQMNLALGMVYLHDGGTIAGEGSGEDLHLVHLLDALDGGTELEATAVLQARLKEVLHDLVRHRGGFALGVEVVHEACAEVRVPLVVDELVEIAARGLQEHEVLEVGGDGRRRYLVPVALGGGTFLDRGASSTEELPREERLDDGSTVAETQGVGGFQPVLETLHLVVRHQVPTWQLFLLYDSYDF